jgi:hypothetical protein
VPSANPEGLPIRRVDVGEDHARVAEDASGVTMETVR